MKANFAIFLTAERLALLRRQGSGWSPVGDVRFDAPDLAAQLATLRRTALGLASSGLRAKVVLPEDQVRYLSVETGDVDLETRIETAAKALEGATPYALDDLRFDLAPDGAVTHVAAVALETLTEAETFLTQHRLGPISFVSSPEPDRFPGEPFFGASTHSASLLDAGEAVEPDGIPVPPPLLKDLPEPADPEGPLPLTVPTAPAAPPPPEAPAALQDIEEEPPAPTAFATRRDIPPPAVTPSPASHDPEASGRTPDGTARDSERRTGLALAVGVAALLAGLVAWNAFFTGDRQAGVDPVPAPEAVAPREVATVDPIEAPEADSAAESAALGTAPTPSSEPERLQPGALPAPLSLPAPREVVVAPQDNESGMPTDGQSARDFYARTGIWTLPPEAPDDVGQVELEDLYVTSIDPENLALDAVALPPVGSFDTDHPVPAARNPAPAGSEFEIDRRGLVTPTPEGTLSHEGVLVHAGKPPAVPPGFPDRVDLVAEAEARQREILSAFRPRLRPEGLIESRERQKTGGLSFAELGKYRPRLRPDTEKQADEVDAAPTALAAAESRRPKTRPDGFQKVVAQAAVAEDAGSDDVQQASAITPSIPSSASVTRQATVANAINLNRINLMGVYGTPSERRALVRLSNGRFKKVEVGDRLDGGRVTAISENALSYSKGARTVVLEMPKT